MNRRQFALCLTAIAALPKVHSAMANRATARWDEASKLFGNAWGLLNEAPPGEIAPIATGLYQHDRFIPETTIVSLVHNNTSEQQILESVEVEGDHGTIALEGLPERISPGGYAFALATVTGLDEAFTEIPEHQFTFEPTTEEPSSTILTLHNAEFDGNLLTLSATNSSTRDFSSAYASVVFQRFTSNGEMSTTEVLVAKVDLGPNESGDVQVYLRSNFESQEPYLIGAITH